MHNQPFLHGDIKQEIPERNWVVIGFPFLGRGNCLWMVTGPMQLGGAYDGIYLMVQLVPVMDLSVRFLFFFLSFDREHV